MDADSIEGSLLDRCEYRDIVVHHRFWTYSFH